ncbi:hypothetical protein LXA43DRAFT_996313 [Ganoderma leucocontextum]|nr:hypothetical protein LXA43DRAFT_996313 [Ganoderma leucocontextum]
MLPHRSRFGTLPWNTTVRPLAAFRRQEPNSDQFQDPWLHPLHTLPAHQRPTLAKHPSQSFSVPQSFSKYCQIFHSILILLYLFSPSSPTTIPTLFSQANLPYFNLSTSNSPRFRSHRIPSLSPLLSNMEILSPSLLSPTATQAIQPSVLPASQSQRSSPLFATLLHLTSHFYVPSSAILVRVLSHVYQTRPRLSDPENTPLVFSLTRSQLPNHHSRTIPSQPARIVSGPYRDPPPGVLNNQRVVTRSNIALVPISLPPIFDDPRCTLASSSSSLCPSKKMVLCTCAVLSDTPLRMIRTFRASVPPRQSPEPIATTSTLAMST